MSGVVARFEAMSLAEMGAFFADSAVEDITATLRDTTEAELERLIDLEHFREQGILTILERFTEFADAPRLAEIAGVVRFDLSRDRHSERHTARFADGDVALDGAATPDVTISAAAVDFVRLATGQADAALLYLSGRLTIDGDELLALAVGTVFTIPGSGETAVDFTTLDPVDVATAVAGTSTRHMRDVMAGGFRPIVLSEVFRRFPEFMDVKKCRTMHLSVGFRIGGRPDGEVDRYVIHVKDGVCTIETDPPEGQRRDATISVEGADFLRLATGQLNPVKGVLKGTLKVKGDRGKALALNGAMNPPQPRC